jgi:hypothetical protein
VGSSSPSCRIRTTEVEASARYLSLPRRSRGEVGPRSGAPNKIRMIFIVSKIRLMKILTIIIIMGKRTNLMHLVAMQRRKQKKEERGSVKRRRKSS